MRISLVEDENHNSSSGRGTGHIFGTKSRQYQVGSSGCSVDMDQSMVHQISTAHPRKHVSQMCFVLPANRYDDCPQIREASKLITGNGSPRNGEQAEHQI